MEGSGPLCDLVRPWRGRAARPAGRNSDASDLCHLVNNRSGFGMDDPERGEVMQELIIWADVCKNRFHPGYLLFADCSHDRIRKAGKKLYSYKKQMLFGQSSCKE